MYTKAMSRLALQLLSLGLVSADVTLQAITDASCGADGGTVLINVHANPANQFQSSGCVTAGTFHSLNVSPIDPGFVCNIYADASCQNFIETISEQVCSPVTGQGIICFSQSLFDNPFALSKAEVTIGQTKILGTAGTFDGPKGMDLVVASAVKTACGDNGCDPNTPLQLKFTTNDCGAIFCNSDETQIVKVSGNYDNANQRDYMSSLLQAVFAKSQSPPDAGVFSNAGDDLVNVVSFAQVVINDQNGNNQAEMAVTISVGDNKGGFDCQGALGTITSALLGAIPSVGGVAAGAFQIGCLAATAGG